MVPLFICITVTLAFLPVLDNGFVNWDDQMVFLDNPDYRGLSFAHLRWMFTIHNNIPHYFPLTWISYGMDYILWGLWPGGYHLTSLLIHLLNAVLVYAVALVMLVPGDPKPRSSLLEGRRIAAAAGALLFALHPLRAETVAWASTRADLIATLFVLLTVYAWMRARMSGSRGWYWLALTCHGLALLGKVSASPLPAVLFLLDIYLSTIPAMPARNARRSWVMVLPFFLLSLPAIWATYMCKVLTGSVDNWVHHSLLARLAQSSWDIWFYPWKTIWPAGLSPLYELEGLLDPARPVYVMAMVATVAVTAFLLISFRRHPGLAMAWLSYLLLSAPVMGWIQAGRQKAADRYSYMACLPFALLASGFLWWRWRTADRPSAGSLALPALVLASLGFLTYRQCRIWHDTVSLWEHAAKADPEGRMVRYFRDKAVLEERQVAALAEVERALVVRPNDLRMRALRGILLVEWGENDRAILDLDAALPALPELSDGFRARGDALRRRNGSGDATRALADYDRALTIAPDYALALQQRAALRRTLGDFDGALEDFAAALKLQPHHWPTMVNYGLALAAKGRKAEAREILARAKAIAPVMQWATIDTAAAKALK